MVALAASSQSTTGFAIRPGTYCSAFEQAISSDSQLTLVGLSFIGARAFDDYVREDCPCPKKKCPRHGYFDECTNFHAAKGKLLRCKRKKSARLYVCGVCG